jgi:molybdenum cofactor cytidylyltransferase
VPAPAAPALVAAVLLAAGESTRMGEAKALLPWTDGRPLLAFQHAALTAAGYAPVIVVLGHRARELRAALPPDAHTVVNPRYAEGRATSIAAGVRALPDGLAGVLVVSVDQPRAVATLRALREAWERAGRPALAVPALNGLPGHPPLFNARLRAELEAVSEERQGLREVVSRHREARVLVPVDDPLTLTNLNTPADYQAALAAAREAGA